MFLETCSKPSILLPVVLALCYVVYVYLIAKANLPDLPWINLPSGGLLPRTRSRLQTSFHWKSAVESAYENYSKKGLSCILPNISGDVILLPASSTEWIVSQSDQDLNVREAHMDNLQTDYTFSDPVIVRHAHHEQIVKTDLTRQLGNLTSGIMDELGAGFDETWGFDASNWKEIGVFTNMMRIIARTSNRIFVGLPLCRNDSYLYYSACFATDVIPSATVLRQLPSLLRPILAPLITLPGKYHRWKAQQYLEPEITRRLEGLDGESQDPEKKALEVEPNDFLQWSINYARTKLATCPAELSPRILVGRILALNFAAIHTSTFTITNVIFDILSSDPSLNYVGQLREEAASVLAEESGVWTKRALSKMYKIDSAIRESLRVSSFLSVGLVRKVTAKGGITTPDGIHCPRGSNVAVAVYGIHNDDAYFPDAATFDPFRSVHKRDAIVADTLEGKLGTDDMIKRANYGLVSTSPDYLPFGHGRHACPGRFFAANELKLLLAYMILNYDIEMLEKRPAGRWLGQVSLPPMSAVIKVRRRS